ncbi:MAG TPA: HAD hydrolase-like protein [Bacteroidales bacterium]|nr:HAD hydrolase-like protein [Bacteroidales bacterium]
MKPTRPIDFTIVKAIVWDWNGTLLDDIAASLSAMNQMLASRQLPLLSQERYREIFTFPVRDYYQEAGLFFDEEEWDAVAMEFIDNYSVLLPGCGIHNGANQIISYLQNHGYRQFILSAMQQQMLLASVGACLDVKFFESINGLNDHYAHSKEENARLLVASSELQASELLMIGDTLHDYEVATSAGMQCILFSGGHQTAHRLEASGTLVIDKLESLKELL